LQSTFPALAAAFYFAGNTPVMNKTTRKRAVISCLVLTAIICLVILFRQPYDGYPLHLALEPSAGFGEIRPDHFHMGIDLRTAGREGVRVYAIKSGFISRVSIRCTGYGKALFITHADGTTSVYAHLSHFEKNMEKWVVDQQYKTQCQEQDLSLSSSLFPVKKGECIGYSGNTGTSEGPHLHFETRDTRTGKSYNPFLQELRITDTIPPVIRSMYWYNRCNSLYEEAGHRLSQSVTKVQTPFIGLGLEASDQLTRGKFKTGIYKAILYKNGVLQYQFSLPRIAATDTRYVNACIDYARALDSGTIVQLLFTLPGNPLPYAQLFPAGGTIDLSDRRQHQLKIVVSDLAGNQAEKSFTLQYDGTASCIPVHTKLRYPGHESKLHSSNAIVQFSKNAFYDAVPFQLTEEKASQPDAASVVVKLHPATVPVHDSFAVSIQTSLPAHAPLRKRTVMVLSSPKGNTIVKGTWMGNSMKGRFNQLGEVQLLTDTLAPVITVITASSTQIIVKCQDNLGNIASFKGEIDGHWLAFERKGNVFTYTLDEHFPARAHTLTLTVTDIAGNSTLGVHYLL
jgi:murein DD-endopeptidase MepM/ murein hydrolase activator NlpD